MQTILNQTSRARAGRPTLSWAASCAAGILFSAAAAGAGQQAATAKPASEPVPAPVQTASPGPSDATPPAQAEWDMQTALLLRLATELKQEVDKTTENVLSVKVVKTAGEIERLSRSEEQKMKAAVAANN